MTWITDNTGTRWVEMKERPRRKSPRALRFADLKVGDQLVLSPAEHWYPRVPMYFVVTDLWFDPVAGEQDDTAGRMVAIKHVGRDGEPTDGKRPHTLRGLASQGYHYAEIDWIAQGKAAVEAYREGKVIGIGRGHVIRGRPKLPSPTL